MKKKSMIPLIKKVHWNIFTFLLIAAALSFCFRALNIMTFKDREAGVITSAQAVEAKVDDKNSEPPPLTNDDMKKAAAAAATPPDDKAAAAQGSAGTAPGATAETTTDKTAPDKPEAAKTGEDTKTQPTDNPSTLDKTLAAEAPSDEDRAFSASELEVLQSLSKRRDELDKREKKIATREAVLTAAEQEVDKKVAELNKLKGEIEALLGKQQKMEEDRIMSLVKIYENMKPKEAAAIFNTLDMGVLISVISRMKELKSSPILAAMDPEKARIVTIKLAEMRTLPAGNAGGTGGNTAASAPAAPSAPTTAPALPAGQ